MANDRELLELRTVEVKHQSVTVSYPKHLCSRSHAWSHLEHNYPPQVPTKAQLGIRNSHYNPWRRSHTVTHWSWYWHSRVVPKCEEPIKPIRTRAVYADSRYTHINGRVIVTRFTPFGVVCFDDEPEFIGELPPIGRDIPIIEGPRGGFKVFDGLEKLRNEMLKELAVPAELMKGGRR